MTVAQGAAWSRTWPVTGDVGQSLALDGWSARAQVRASVDATAVLYAWSTSALDAVGNAYFTISAVTLTLDGTESANWVWRRGVWDLYLFDPSGVPTRLVEGTFAVSPRVTR